MPKGKHPHYILTAKSKKEGSFGSRIGAAWMNERGAISIRLSPCVTISDRDDIWIGLFPNKDNPPPVVPANASFTMEDIDDVPF